MLQVVFFGIDGDRFVAGRDVYVLTVEVGDLERADAVRNADRAGLSGTALGVIVKQTPVRILHARDSVFVGVQSVHRTKDLALY